MIIEFGDYPQVHGSYSKLRLVKRQEHFAADFTNFRGLALKKSAPISETCAEPVEVSVAEVCFSSGIGGQKDVGNHQLLNQEEMNF